MRLRDGRAPCLEQQCLARIASAMREARASLGCMRREIRGGEVASRGGDELIPGTWSHLVDRPAGRYAGAPHVLAGGRRPSGVALTVMTDEREAKQ
jgi:hypothetical protein